MSYARFNITTELRKAAQGKKLKVDVGTLLWLATKGYPHIQARIAEVFSIEWD